MSDPAATFDTTTQPCPDWCDRPTGHGYEFSDHECETRIHSRDVGEVLAGEQLRAPVSVSALEDLVLDDGGTTVRHHSPTISVYSGGEELSASMARQLAAMLLDAADLCVKVTGS